MKVLQIDAEEHHGNQFMTKTVSWKTMREIPVKESSAKTVQGISEKR